ncbi:MAG: hypothetical protein AAF581_15025 [Planctomycetota bacterium]
MKILMKFILLLALAIALPIAVLEVKYRMTDPNAPGSGSVSGGGGAAGGGNAAGSGNSAGSGGAAGNHLARGGAAPAEVGVDLDNPAVVGSTGTNGAGGVATAADRGSADRSSADTETTVREVPPPGLRGHYHFAGELTGPSGQERQELRVTTASGDRTCWANRAGEFSFAVREEQFPVQLFTKAGDLLYVRPEPPATSRVLLTAGRLHSPSFHKGLILPRALSTEVDANGRCEVVVYGTTLLPQGSEIVIRLQTRGRETVQESVHELVGDGVLSRLSGSTEGLYFGQYLVQLAWRPLSDPKAMAMLTDVLPDPLPPGELPKRLVVRMFLGSKADAAEQERQIQEYYEDAIEMCLDSRDLLLSLGKRLRNKSFRKSTLQRTLKRRDAPSAAKALARGGTVSVKAWRRLLDKEFPELWRRYRDKEQVPYAQKYPGRLAQLHLAFSHLVDLAKLESQLLYRHLNRPMDQRDYLDPEFGLDVFHGFTLDHLNTVIDGIEQDL